MSVLLLAGQIGAGKSTVARHIAQSSSSRLISVRAELAHTLRIVSTDRALMQERAAQLDIDSNGYWLVRCLSKHWTIDEDLVVDSVRTVRQVNAVRREFDATYIAYLEATEDTRRIRYSLGRGTDLMKAAASFDLANQHSTEKHVKNLYKLANFVVQTDEIPPEEIASILIGKLR